MQRSAEMQQPWTCQLICVFSLIEAIIEIITIIQLLSQLRSWFLLSKSQPIFLIIRCNWNLEILLQTASRQSVLEIITNSFCNHKDLYQISWLLNRSVQAEDHILDNGLIQQILFFLSPPNASVSKWHDKVDDLTCFKDIFH